MRILLTLALLASITLAAGAEQARKQLDRGDAEAAVKTARAAVKKNDKDVDAWIVLGEALDATGEPEDAWTEIEKAIEIIPKSGRLALALGDIFVKLAQKEAIGSKDGPTINNFFLDAERMYDSAVALDPKLHRALFGKAFVNHQLGRNEVARKALADCLRVKKDYGKAHALQAYMLYLDRKYDAARDKYAIALKLDRSDPLDFIRYGHCFFSLQQKDKALEQYIAALKEHPDYETAIRSGIYYVADKDWKKAEPFLKQATMGAPKSAWVWFWYGYVLGLNDKWGEALVALQQADRIRPNDAQFLYYLGYAHESMNDAKKALAYYRKSLKESPGYEPAVDRFWRLAIGRASGDFAQAEKLLEELIKLAPENGWTMNNYALLLRDWAQARGAATLHPPADVKRRIKRSAEIYEMSAKLLPNEAQIQSDTGLLFEFYPVIRDDEKAERYFLRSLELSDFTYRDAWSGMYRLCRRTKNFRLLKECAEGVLGALEDSGKMPLAPTGGGAPSPVPGDKPGMIAQAKHALALAKKAGVK